MMARIPRQHDLARLILEVKEGTGWSDEDIAERARERRHSLSKQHVQNLRAQNPLKSIVPSTMEALAAGLEVPLRRVVEAAIASAGLPVSAPTDWSIETAIDHDPHLPIAAKRLLKQSVAVARGVTAPTPIRKATPAGKAARRRPTD